MQIQNSEMHFVTSKTLVTYGLFSFFMSMLAKIGIRSSLLLESMLLGRLGCLPPGRPIDLTPLVCLQLERIDFEARNGIEIHLSGVDFLDETPVLDIKPYLPYVDCIPNAKGGWTETKIPTYAVQFSEMALKQIGSHPTHHLKELIEQMLSLDPRPTSQRRTMPIEDPQSEGRQFAFRMLDFDVKWSIQNFGVFVDRIMPV